MSHLFGKLELLRICLNDIIIKYTYVFFKEKETRK